MRNQNSRNRSDCQFLSVLPARMGCAACGATEAASVAASLAMRAARKSQLLAPDPRSKAARFPEDPQLTCSLCQRNITQVEKSSKLSSDLLFMQINQRQAHKLPHQSQRVSRRPTGMAAHWMCWLPLTALTILSATSVTTSSKLEPEASLQQQVVTDRQGNTVTNGSTFGDLVAVGAISLSAPPVASQHKNNGRLVDRIATPASGLRDLPAPTKMDYIIEFLRQNKLSKFCDFLTSQTPETREILRKLNGLDQFTLFVPTNEAILLMPTDLTERISRQPEEMHQFLLSHATGELVVPKLDPVAQRELLAASRWSSIRGQLLANRPDLVTPSTALASTNLMFSLAGTQLRITTAPISHPAAINSTAPATTKLELIVNGANVLSGNSHALQEPNNSNVTYAIVHLIDRSLYPAPSSTLASKVRALSPRMANYIDMAQDERLNEALETNRQLWTLFLPSSDAFKAVSKKLVDQLETNRTFLMTFLRNHLVEGLHYSIQLAAKKADVLGNKLSSYTGQDIEIEQKSLPSRSLLVVNSIPIAEPDIMATNGVVHLIARPIFEKSLLESCNCDATSNKTETTTLLSTDTNTVWPTSNRAQASTIENWATSRTQPTGVETGTVEKPASGNELEREESQVVSASKKVVDDKVVARVRSQRSDSLVERNNRDFYRPSMVPANLQPQSGNQNRRQDSLPDQVGQGFITSDQVDELNRLLAAQRINETRPQPGNAFIGSDLFEAERYKVLNASVRQKMREQTSNQPDVLINSSSQLVSSANPRFAYDKPLTTQPTTSLNSEGQIYPEFENSAGKRLYWAINSTKNPFAPSNNTGAGQLWGELQNQRLMLKFQPEDARDLTPAANRIQNATLGANQPPMMQPAYNVISTRDNWNNPIRGQLGRPASSFASQNQQLTSKTAAPPGFGGCAFYDAECKRLVGKLVRLPPTGAGQKKSPLLSVASSTSSPLTVSFPYLTANQTASGRLPHYSGQHLDSTFGETTENPLQSTTLPSYIASQPTTSSPQQPRISPLDQPLPPWNPEEDLRKQPAGVAASNWRATIGNDINRISLQDAKRAQSGLTSGISREQTVKTPAMVMRSNNTSSQFIATHSWGPSAQIMLVPVRLLQQQQLAKERNSSANQSVYLSPQLVNRLVEKSQSAPKLFRNHNYHTPTPQPTFPTVRPPTGNVLTSGGFHVPTLGRLTNFTAIETVAGDNAPIRSQPASSNKTSPLRSPVFAGQRKSRLNQVVHFDTNGTLTTSSSSFLNDHTTTSLTNAQQARKIVRLQPSPSGVWPSGIPEQFNGDISVTSAKLTQNPSKLSESALNVSGTSSGLATQASDQSPNTINGNSNFVRSIPASELAASTASSSADFFQDRTIADIMDDSGLKIDGQQVTFVRLKECLKDANLLNLVTQTGNSVTIFMPTDSAFQRLVQQQAIEHQKERQASSSGRVSISARLVDSNRRQLIPLIVRTKPIQPITTTADTNGRLTFDPIDSSATSAAERLTLDCSTQQVRQLLLDHISVSMITPKQLVSDTILSGVSGHQLLLSSVPSKKIVVVDGQPVIAATRAKNGMVYVVNKFLNLTQQMPNVIDLIETQPNLTTFLSYLTFSSLAERLKRETGPITLLAPTNEAFEQLSSSARQLINSDPSALMDILRGHVVEGAQFGKLISMRNRLKTLNADQNIEARVIKPNLYQLDNQMTSMRLVGTTGNGVVNAIDRLIVPTWLKVSMNPKSGAISPVVSPFAGEFDSSPAGSGNLNNSISSLNLPLIGRQPTRFEQPAGSRLNTLPASNSANSLPFLGSNNNNNLLGFDFAPTESPPGDSLATQRSPFLRASTIKLANNGSLDPLTSRNSNRNVNRTKNMQLIEKLTNLMGTRKFANYLFRSRISDQLKPDMNYVILVPTDQAIEKLPRQIIDTLDKDLDRLSDLVNYHVLDTTFEYINTIPDGQTLNTLNEKDILFNWHRNNTILTASGAVVLGGIQEENIALLIVDRVLYPTPGDILNIISKSPILSNFTSLVKQAGLERQLSLAGPYTLFAPSDIAFNQLDKRQLEFLRDKETARRFLLRHLSQPAIFTSSIALSNLTTTSTGNTLRDSSAIRLQQTNAVPTMTISNSLGEDLTLRQRNEYFSVNEVNFSYADVAATNGVVHVIDGLL